MEKTMSNTQEIQLPPYISELLTKSDLTKQENHAIKLLVDKIQKKLNAQYNINSSIESGNPIVSISDNYYELGYQTNEVTLGVRYTKYVDDKLMLRTQMSSTIPALLRDYKKSAEINKRENTLWLCPGMVYRRDVRDKTHVGEPHQLDIWYLSSIKKNREDLLILVQSIISVIEEEKNQKIQWRYTETNHPYTDNGIEVEIMHKGKWLEILECGLIAQNLLDKNALSSYGGLALGLGLERLLMIIKEIDDIRVINSNNPSIAKQMLNLKKYKEISNQPSLKRDLSIAVDKDILIEEITEKILENLHLDMQQKIESIALVAETLYENLPQIAIERLGININQKNYLIRIILRDISNSLTHEEGNLIYTEIYEKIHEGEKGYGITYAKK